MAIEADPAQALADMSAAVEALARKMAGQRTQRMQATNLISEDFDALADAGFLRLTVPAHAGGWWQDLGASLPPMADLIRTLARGDGSTALVASMHPIVVAYWLASGDSTAADLDVTQQARWSVQQNWVWQSACEGAWWGTLTSEPGSGGDIEKSRAMAYPEDNSDLNSDADQHDGLRYRLSGEKHFGSGSGQMDYMVTTAKTDPNDRAVMFFMDMRGRVNAHSDTSTTRADQELVLKRRWDGYGMTATQSHAFTLEGMPAVRIAEPTMMAAGRATVAIIGAVLFTSVAMGLVDNAVAYTRNKLAAKLTEDGLDVSTLERAGLLEIDNRAWLIEKLYQGLLADVRAIHETEQQAPSAAITPTVESTLRGKFVIAQQAEALLQQMMQTLGGSAFSRSQPLLAWSLDLKALGYLRPPWPLAAEQLLALSEQKLRRSI